VIEPGADLTGSAANLAQPVVELPSTGRSRTVYIAGAVALVLLLAAGGGFFLLRNRSVVTPTPPPQTQPEQPQQTLPKPVPIAAEMVAIPGGSFLMGSNKGLPQEAPAHQVTVGPFMMDKTEVTNAAYAEFVASSNYQPPADWSGNKPPAGQELLPVTGVSLDDANAFAAWRSQRDGVSYRLPTEEEWEFAARNGSQADNYPWGDIWSEDKANLTKVIRPVGSYPAGQNKWGVMDLIGNVWEWTSSEIKLYPGSPSAIRIPATQASWVLIRGGSHSSEASGPTAVSSFKREWVDPVRKDGKLGFRLVGPPH
jgi:LPXTG-motif cell wall-anchored protein